LESRFRSAAGMDDVMRVLSDWYTRVDASQRAHYLSADKFRRFSYFLGVPTVILTLFVGTSVFATLQSKPSLSGQIVVGACSVLAAILAGLQTFFGYAERSEKHRMAGAKYGALGRELEVLRASPAAVDPKIIDRIREKIDALALESPINSKRIYELGLKQSS
jgi:hypothetical protein